MSAKSKQSDATEEESESSDALPQASRPEARTTRSLGEVR
jgi:hypothetical protein